MADPKDLAARLRHLASGAVEWRVQDPVEKCYCISFNYGDTADPERAAREWLAVHQTRFPNSQHAHYEVAKVRWFSVLEQAALDAADLLDSAGVSGMDTSASDGANE